MTNWIDKYGELLANYCLYLKEGEQVYVRSTTLAEPLIKSFYKEAILRGATVIVDLSFEHQEEILQTYGNDSQLKYVNKNSIDLIKTCDAYILIRAPYLMNTNLSTTKEKNEIRVQANAEFQKIYFERLGNKSLKRSLCQFPTEFAAKQAGMNLEEYSSFIQNACFLHFEKPEEKWLEVSRFQQGIVDYLNRSKKMIYRHPQFEISFDVTGRTWINSDGKSNMPSGEVFTSPIEDSVEGEIYFDMPTFQLSKDVQGIRLKVEKGNIVSYSAEIGQEVLDQIFSIPGTRRFGEVAIGTNMNIQRATKNILFDEKIGGTVHMAIGQSYLQCGGKNESSIHWDLITNMKNGGEIFADGLCIYRNGEFLI